MLHLTDADIVAANKYLSYTFDETNKLFNDTVALILRDRATGKHELQFELVMDSYLHTYNLRCVWKYKNRKMFGLTRYISTDFEEYNSHTLFRKCEDSAESFAFSVLADINSIDWESIDWE